MKATSFVLQMLLGIGLAFMVTGGIVMANCNDDGTCKASTDGTGCTEASAGENCDTPIECTCQSTAGGGCKCNN